MAKLKKIKKKLTEKNIQALLMTYAMFTRRYKYVVPNSTQIMNGEADIIAVTRAHLSHEYEIKLNRTDYKHDFTKVKHRDMQMFFKREDAPHFIPNHFWFVTYDFDIEPPEYAGWMKITWREDKQRFFIQNKKPAPRIHNNKIKDRQLQQIANVLSYHLERSYRSEFAFKENVPANRAMMDEEIIKSPGQLATENMLSRP